MRNNWVKNFVLLIVISMISLISSSQTVIFNESFGTPAATTTIAAFTGWSNGVGLTFDQGGAANAADIRNTSTSTGYTGSSAGGNVFCTAATERGIGINGIQAASYSNLTLSFGYRKESATVLPALQVDFWDGSAWVNVPFTFSQTAAAGVAWYLVSGLNLPSTAQINGLKIRFVKTGTTTSVRIDDVKLQGDLLAPTALSVSNISSPQTQNVTFSVTVNAVNGSGSALAVTQNTTIVLSTNGNAGNLIGTTSATMNSGSSSVTFTGLSLDGSGSGVTIIATTTSGNTLTSATSNTFTVSAAAANDCAGVPGGTALPGTSCDDNNACTINDVWSASCVCAGTIQDTDGDGTCDATDECDNDPNKILAGACGCGSIEVGQACNDNNACTENDVITACGVCSGTALLDTDSDGTCDLTDECDSDPNKILAGTCGCGNAEPTTACDDLNAITSNDIINGSCVCQGLYPVIYYDFSTAAPASNAISNLAPTAVTRGNNNGTTNGLLNGTSASSGYLGSSGGFNGGVAARAGALDLTASSGSAYFEFSLDADQNYSLTITQITIGTRSTSTGPQAITLRSSADGYVADLATTTVSSNSTWALKTFTLTNYATIPGSNVTYRLYGHNGTGSPTTNTTNWRIDDLNIYGYTTFVPPVPIVQFNSPTQTGLETTGSDQLTVTMDIAPSSDVVVSVANLGTGTATASTDFSFGTSSLTFTSGETYPSSKTVSLTIINDTEVEPIETIAFGLSVTSGTATLGTSTLTYSLSSDDLAQLVINEVDYDMNGSDNAEWVEIKNNGTTAVDINGYKLELVNGGTTPGTVYTTITLASTSTLIQPGGYYVIGNNSTIANINLVVTPTTNLIQNGAPDAIGLKDNSNNLLDAVSYEGNTSSPYNEGASVNTLADIGSANFPSGTIGRFPDGLDTGDNMVDLRTLCVGTPGATNTPSTSTFYEDNDADTFGNVDSTIAACEAPVGYVSNSTDCNDFSAVSNPAAVEICDGLDNDCTAGVDNGLTFVNYYNDADGDTYGSGTATNACQSPGASYVTNNTDCDDALATTNPGASEICDGLDNDCTAGVDNGLTFVNYYNDADGDTYGSGTATNACQSPGASYVTNNTDCNDASSSVNAVQNWYADGDMDGYDVMIVNSCNSPGPAFTTNAGIYGMGDCDDALSTVNPGATEVCGNGIDDDCSAGDLVCPVSPFEAALNVVNIGQFGTGAQATQSVNLATGINTVQSPGLGLDKWFSFTAASNAMRIAILGNSGLEDDNDLSLYETPTDPTVQLIPIASENDVHPGATGAATDGGSETLIYDQLIVGDVYYLCVRNNNNTAGNVTLTVSNLNASTTDIALYTNGTNTFSSACQNFKVKFRPNSAGYTINRWSSSDVTGTPVWSYAIPVTSTVASTICQLGRIVPANLSGSNQTVYVTVDVLYNLTDAFGTVTPATARGSAAASFQLSSEADLNVRTTDRCAAGFKSITSSIATNRSVCGTTRYVWEMTMVIPQASLPLTVQGPVGGSRVLMLNAVPAIANGQRYDVKVASKHVDGVSQTAYGSSQCVKTLGAAGMPTIEEQINVFERSFNGVTTSIYPNPNNGSSVNLNVDGMEGELQVHITDATGRMVYSNRYIVEGAMNTTMDFGQNLASGVYMVEMTQNGQFNTMRMVVSK